MPFRVALLVCGIPLLLLASEPVQPPVTRTPDQMLSELKKLYPENSVHDPDEQRRGFLVHPDFEVSLFASSPWVINPIAMAWDEQNRLWVINSPMYPQILPGQRPMDFISVLEDTTGDGRADRCTIFYDQLYVPTGVALGDGGVYVANQPDLLFLRDTTGDGRADRRQILLSGFGTEDNHHAISAFRWGPDGWLYFMSGVFLHTQVETPHGLVRVEDGATFRFQPSSQKLETYNVGTATNPWGLAFNEWGQSFLTEGPQGGIWHLNPGHVRTRPAERTPDTAAPKACGHEFLYSEHFAYPYRGLLALNAFKNKTVSLYEFSDDGAGFATKEMQPLLIRSNEPYFRPVDVKLGPDGALYVADFFQEVIGHMQYEFRDGRRDHLNGRIWRITQKNRDLLSKLDWKRLTLPQLAEQLKSPNSFQRDTARRLLRERAAKERETVVAALRTYLADLKQDHERFAHHQLEGLWAFQTVGHAEPDLLRAVLRSSDPNARAAACIVLREWLHLMPDAFELLTDCVRDAQPRVRMEALVTLSYLPQRSDTINSVALAADQTMDRSLSYAFRHTVRALRPQWEASLNGGTLDLGDPNRLAAVLTAGGGSQGTVATLLSMLKSGTIQPAGRAAAIDLIATVANPKEWSIFLEPSTFADADADRLKDWHVAGLFNFDMKKPIAEQVQPFESKMVTLEAQYTNEAGGAVKWRRIPGRGPIDLNRHFQQTDGKFAYAVAALTLQHPRRLELEVTSDDSVEVYVNGAKVHSHQVARSVGQSWDRIPLELPAGTHQVLLKIGNITGGFGFDLKVKGLEIKNYDAHLHTEVLAALARALEKQPAGFQLPLQRVRELASGGDDARQAAVKALILAIAAPEAAAEYQNWTASPREPVDVRKRAVLALGKLGQTEYLTPLLNLVRAPAEPLELRLLAAGNAARIDAGAAAPVAAALLAGARLDEPPADLLTGFVGSRGGDAALAQALAAVSLPTDTAKLALRWLNGSGQPAPQLTDLLSKIAGTTSLAKELEALPLSTLMAEVASAGDPGRGERVFRRQDLACLGCHAVAGGGASIGPDLEGLGTSSPLDYLVESILLPNKAVREGYGGVTLLTDRGQLITGIPIKKANDAWVLKDAATRKVIRVPTASIEETKDAGSIMPANLVDQMTKQEFLDLVRFVQELGRPGPYATPNLPVFRSWQHLQGTVSLPTGSVNASYWDRPEFTWQPIYTQTNGHVPLAEFADARTVVLKTRLDVGTGGQLQLKFNDAVGLRLWVDGEPVPVEKSTKIQVEAGKRTLVVVIDRRLRSADSLRMEVADVQGSPARGQVVKYEW